MSNDVGADLGQLILDRGVASPEELRDVVVEHLESLGATEGLPQFLDEYIRDPAVQERLQDTEVRETPEGNFLMQDFLNNSAGGASE